MAPAPYQARCVFVQHPATTQGGENIILHYRVHGCKTRILLLILLMVFGNALYGQAITLSKKDASLESIILELSKQTGYNFFYDEGLVRNTGRITIDVKNASLKEVLDRCSKTFSLSYIISDSSVT
jgi:type II secretory pathway component GspD/PulD (secretin)